MSGYVWGQAVQKFLGAGRPGAKPESISRTIENAMTLVKDMGDRYLSVDSVYTDQNE